MLKKYEGEKLTEFENDFNQVVIILENSDITREYKDLVAEDFCCKYVYFDSSKFDCYF